MRARVLKVTSGTVAPSLMGVECSSREGLEREDIALEIRGALEGANAVAERRRLAARTRENFMVVKSSLLCGEFGKRSKNVKPIVLDACHYYIVPGTTWHIIVSVVMSDVCYVINCRAEL